MLAAVFAANEKTCRSSLQGFNVAVLVATGEVRCNRNAGFFAPPNVKECTQGLGEPVSKCGCDGAGGLLPVPHLYKNN
jgi:hypothetical protein